MKKNSGSNDASPILNDRRGRAVPVAVLLIFVVLLSIGSGFYASASYFAQQAPTDVTVTTIVYTTTTSWTTSTIWSTVTSVVYGVWTTVQYTTSTSTVTLTGAPITGNYGDTSVEPYPAIITSASAHFLYFTPFTTPSGGLTVQSLSIYIGTSNGNLDMAIYADSSGSPSGATLVNTGLVTMGPSGAWQTISVSAYHLSPSTQYWIAVLFTSGSANLRYNPASGTARWQNIGTSTTMPSPVGPVTSQTCKISMYVTGTIP